MTNKTKVISLERCWQKGPCWWHLQWNSLGHHPSTPTVWVDFRTVSVNTFSPGAWWCIVRPASHLSLSHRRLILHYKFSLTFLLLLGLPRSLKFTDSLKGLTEPRKAVLLVVFCREVCNTHLVLLCAIISTMEDRASPSYWLPPVHVICFGHECELSDILPIQTVRATVASCCLPERVAPSAWVPSQADSLLTQVRNNILWLWQSEIWEFCYGNTNLKVLMYLTPCTQAVYVVGRGQLWLLSSVDSHPCCFPGEVCGPALCTAATHMEPLQGDWGQDVQKGVCSWALPLLCCLSLRLVTQKGQGCLSHLRWL
jgi:hypothetical protein